MVDLDDLKHWYRRKAADLTRIIAMGSEIVDEHEDMYRKITRGFDGRDAG